MKAREKKAIDALREHALLATITKETAPANEKKVAKLEKKFAVRLPDVLREILVRYGGVTFPNGIEIDLDAIVEKFGDYLQIAREPDGSPYLIAKSKKPCVDCIVYRYGHDEGDDEPVQFAPTILKWLADQV